VYEAEEETKGGKEALKLQNRPGENNKREVVEIKVKRKEQG